MSTPLAAVALSLFAAAGTLAQEATGDRAAIERAVLDYAESYYEVNTSYVERSISKDLVKVGFQLKDGEYEQHPMTYADFMAMVEWFESSGKTPDAGPKDIVILDAMDVTALVKLTGSWGIDYMQLAKIDGRWQTHHVVWQTLPPERTADELAADEAAVARAAHDYLDALYLVKPELMQRSVAPELAKFGFWRQSAEDDYKLLPMNYEQLVALAGEWNQDGHVRADGSRSVEVVEVMDRVACAVVIAEWGIDYMHFTKVDDQWRIVQVLWQSKPESRS